MIITTKLEHLRSAIDLSSYQEKVNAIDRSLKEKTGEGNNFLGWVDLPINYDQNELENIKKYASYVRENYKVLVVCGIGGSYLGARAAIEAINGLYPCDNEFKIIYLGQTLDPTYLRQSLEYLKDKKFAVNVISKSGSTIETSVSFRLLREMLEARDGREEAKKAIFVTTSASKGALHELSLKEGYVSFVLPDNIGGRYSVLTAVGLFPIACAGIDPKAMLRGAKQAREDTSNPDLSVNECYKYAVVRHALYENYHKSVEILVTYVPSFMQLSEWWKQLFGESEGKEGKGLLPDSATFTTDLHSLGQFIQEGSPIFFETTIHLATHREDVEIPYDEENLDGLNYLVSKSMAYIQDKAYEGTIIAHTDSAKIDNIVIDLEKMSDFNLGYLFYWFERACAMSAYLNGVNPFNQPGVEVYKKNMFHFLKRPGY